MSWQATHWNEDQNGNQGYPALDWEDGPTFDMTINIDGEGSELNYGEGTHSVEYNSSVTLEASSGTDWQFVNWTGHTETTDKIVTFDMPAEDTTMTATFEKEDYNMTTPSIPYQSIPYQNRKIPDENNRQPTVKYRIGKNRR